MIAITTDKYVWLDILSSEQHPNGVDIQLCKFISDKFNFKYYMNSPVGYLPQFPEGDGIPIRAQSKSFSTIEDLVEHIKNTEFIMPYRIYYSAPKPEYESFDPYTGKMVLLDTIRMTETKINFSYGLTIL